MKKLLFVMPALCFLFVSPLFAADGEQPVLTTVHQKIGEEFSRLDAAMQDAARNLGTAGLTGDSARASLAALCGKFTFAVDCAAVDTKGRMVTLEPPPYRRFEGTDISAQKQIKAVIKKQKPVMSPVFKSVEGVDAVDVEHPIVNAQGAYIGSVSLLFKPEALFTQILPPLLTGIPVDIWVMEKNGRIVYDADSSQIGHNLFTSPIYRSYTQLLKLGRRISVKQEGSGSYRYKVRGENRVAKKSAYWKSAVLYGTEWRVVGVHVEKDTSGGNLKPNGIAPKPEERLESFAAEGRLIDALGKEDKDEAMRLFKMFYDATPGIYAIEWVDEEGINRFGYPAENSITDYDYRQKKGTKDQAVLEVLKSRTKASREDSLIEGGIGIFNFVPVLDGDRHLGMIYIIRLKR
jgi:hypothetical protein